MGGRRAVLLVTALAAACNGGGGGGGGDDDASIDSDAGVSIDAWGPVRYSGVASEPVIAPIAPLRARIDGVERMTLERTYDTEADWRAATITFELLAGDQIVDSYTVQPAAAFDAVMGGQCQPGRLLHDVINTMCVYDHGEIRLCNLWLIHPEGAGCGPGGLPQCPFSGCGTGRKCSAAFLANDLMYSRVQCVAAGARTGGETCAFQMGSDGRWSDDCADQLVCLQGICRPRCRFEVVNDCGTSATCTRMPRAHQEIAGCVPS
jgi:hypothetical protein